MQCRLHNHAPYAAAGCCRAQLPCPIPAHASRRRITPILCSYTRQEKHARLHHRIKMCDQWQQIRFLLNVSRKITTEEHGLTMLSQLVRIQLRSQVSLIESASSRQTVLQAYELATQQDIRWYSANDLADFITAISILGLPKPFALKSAVAASIPQLSTTSTQHIVQALWALALVGFHLDPAQIAAYMHQISSRIDGCTPRQLVALSSALATLGLSTGANLLRKMDAAVLARFDTFTIQQLLLTIRSLQLMGHIPSEQLLRSLLSVIEEGAWQLLEVEERIHALNCITCCGQLTLRIPELSRCASLLLLRGVLPHLEGRTLTDLVSILMSAAHLFQTNAEQVGFLWAPAATCRSMLERTGTGPVSAGAHLSSLSAHLSSLSASEDATERRQRQHHKAKWMVTAMPKVLAACRMWLEAGRAVDPHQLLQLARAVAILKLRPSSAWWHVFLTRSLEALPRLDPMPLVELLDCLLHAGVSPSMQWLDVYWGEIDRGLGACGVEGMVAVLRLQKRWHLVLPHQFRHKLQSVMQHRLDAWGVVSR